MQACILGGFHGLTSLSLSEHCLPSTCLAAPCYAAMPHLTRLALTSCVPSGMVHELELSPELQVRTKHPLFRSWVSLGSKP